MTTIAKRKSTQVRARVYRMSLPDHNCPWGLRAIQLLQNQGIPFEDIQLRSRRDVEAFKVAHKVTTTPQIFFGEERVGGYAELAARLAVPAEKADYSYMPVIALFGTAALMALAASLGLMGFMGIALSLLAMLKLMDIPAFAESFRKYDLVTRRWRPYSKIYPFLELLIGLGILSGIVPLGTGIGAVAIGLMGMVSIIKAVYIDKLALSCACVGGNFKAPLGMVSLIENAMMVVMGFGLIGLALWPGGLAKWL